MDCKLEILPTAERELDGIVAYLASFGADAALGFLDEWDKALELLRDGFVKHRLSRFEVLARLGYRTMLLGGYVILYYEEGDKIVLAHIFHQSQDYANLV